MNNYTIHKIEKVNYTFNYDGRTYSSFSHALNGLERMLVLYDAKIPINIILSFSEDLEAISETQKNEINKVLITSNRKPLFHLSSNDKIHKQLFKQPNHTQN